MTVLLANNVSTSLAAPLSAVATSMTVTNGSRFPVLTAGQYFYATIIATSGVVEIVKVVTRNGNAMAITRAQDGTNAQAFSSGARVEMRINAAAITETVTDRTGPLDTRLTTAEGDINALEGRMTTAETDINLLEGRMTTAESDIVALETDVLALEAFDTTLGTSAGSNTVGFLQVGTSATARTVQAKLRDVISVKDFGAVGDGVANDTAAMQAAHNTGRTIFYPKGTYNFTTITIPSGGIVGEGKLTILRTTDTGTGDVITYTSVDPTGLLINTVGGLFSDFTLLATTHTQKAAGAGISIVPAPYSGSPNEDYLTILSGVYTRNLPIGASFVRGSFFSVRDCYFSLFTVAGVYADINDATFQDNGDNEIIGNFFFTNAAIGPSARGIWYRCGGARIIGNKVNGGLIGIDINPLRGTSIAIVSDNSVENQTVNAIRAYIGSDFTPISVFDGFSFVQIDGNQIGGYNLTGPAIVIDSYASDPKFYNCAVQSNVIYNPHNTGSRAIDIRQVDRFIVANNFVDSATVGYGSLFVASSATSGLVTRNQFLRASVNNILVSSTSTVLDEIVADYTTTYDPPSINAAATHTLTVTVTGARFGNYVVASMGLDIGGITLTAHVSAADTVTVVFSNNTAFAINIGSGTLRLRVFSN